MSTKAIGKMNSEEFAVVMQAALNDYHQEPEQRKKLTPDQIKKLAERLNRKVNIPIISETREEKILIKIIVKVDTFLYDNLPNEFYDLVVSVEKGIDDDEAKRLIKRLSKLANIHIDIPYIPESYEYVAVRFVISVIINAARKHFNFDESAKQLENINIPSSKAAADDEFDSLLVPKPRQELTD